MSKQLMGYCRKCDAVLPVSKRSTGPFILHLVGVILTGGLWIIPYLLMKLEAAGHKPKCPKCRGYVKC